MDVWEQALMLVCFIWIAMYFLVSLWSRYTRRHYREYLRLERAKRDWKNIVEGK